MLEVIAVMVAGVCGAWLTTLDEHTDSLMCAKALGVAGIVVGVSICLGGSFWPIKDFLKILIASGAIVFGNIMLIKCVLVYHDRNKASKDNN